MIIWPLGRKARCSLLDEATYEAALASFPVSDLWGIGRQWGKKLNGYGITTAQQLRDVDQKWMRQHFSVVGERLVRELNNQPCAELEQNQSKKNIMSSKPFGRKVMDKQTIIEAVANYAARAWA